jgi:hypothetical protein
MTDMKKLQSGHTLHQLRMNAFESLPAVAKTQQELHAKKKLPMDEWS